LPAILARRLNAATKRRLKPGRLASDAISSTPAWRPKMDETAMAAVSAGMSDARVWRIGDRRG
jgi:hypothetical protein